MINKTKTIVETEASKTSTQNKIKSTAMKNLNEVVKNKSHKVSAK